MNNGSPVSGGTNQVESTSGTIPEVVDVFGGATVSPDTIHVQANESRNSPSRCTGAGLGLELGFESPEAAATTNHHSPERLNERVQEEVVEPTTELQDVLQEPPSQEQMPPTGVDLLKTANGMANLLQTLQEAALPGVGGMAVGATAATQDPRTMTTGPASHAGTAPLPQQPTTCHQTPLFNQQQFEALNQLTERAPLLYGASGEVGTTRPASSSDSSGEAMHAEVSRQVAETRAEASQRLAWLEVENERLRRQTTVEGHDQGAWSGVSGWFKGVAWLVVRAQGVECQS